LGQPFRRIVYANEVHASGEPGKGKLFFDLAAVVDWVVGLQDTSLDIDEFKAEVSGFA
jgi:hypothetical protein